MIELQQEDGVDQVDHAVSVVDKRVLQANQETHQIKEMVENVADMVRKTGIIGNINLADISDEEEEDVTDAAQIAGANAAKIQELNDHLSPMLSALQTVENTVAKIQRDQARLGKRLDELSTHLPGATAAEEKSKNEVKDLATRLRERNNLRKGENSPAAGGGAARTVPGGTTPSGLRE